jgi:DNA-binding FrmR family transcriptional regulator
MKYKTQALSKIEQIQNRINAIDSSIGRASSIQEIRQLISSLKEMVDNLHGTISNENDEMNY